jgi:hypothetical protein
VERGRCRLRVEGGESRVEDGGKGAEVEGWRLKGGSLGVQFAVFKVEGGGCRKQGGG